MIRLRHRDSGSSAVLTTGETYIRKPASTGTCGMQSCIRCGSHRLPSELESDTRMRYQKRCIDRELCATALGGKS